MRNYVIDGIFLQKKITGIQRYAIEITKCLDQLVEKGTMKLAVPEYWDGKLSLANIEIIRYGNHSSRVWEQTDLVDILKKENAEGIFFENTIPLKYRKGIVVVHDVSLRANPNLFRSSIRGLLTIMWRRYMYSAIMKSNMKIVTVSEFSKKEIIKYYHVDPGRITVIYNAWQHMISVEPDDSVFQDGRIVPGKYHFAMATLAANKNFKWIASAAQHNPNEIFVIAGGGKMKDAIAKEYRNLGNLIYLGYVSDEKAKALLGQCKAFICPSFYEGFGIPPLEAAACGAKALILSDIECFHEIYGEHATYIDPYDYAYRFNIKPKSKYDPAALLKNYGWDKSAQRLFKLLNKLD